MVKTDVLVLLEFDDVLTDVDSDRYLTNKLHADAANQIWALFAADKTIGRANAMDAFFAQVAQDYPTTKIFDNIRKHVENLPCNERIVDAICLAVDTYGATIKIVSDSLVCSIRSFLDFHELTHRVSEVVANPTHLEHRGKVFRVLPYQGAYVDPHTCDKCPRNLCKGQVLQRLLQQQRYSKVLYVSGRECDTCIVSKLQVDDVVFIRSSTKKQGLIQMHEKWNGINAHFREWTTEEDFYADFRAFFDHQYSKYIYRNVRDLETHTDKDSTFSLLPSLRQKTADLLILWNMEISIYASCQLDAIHMALHYHDADIRLFCDGKAYCIKRLSKKHAQVQHVKTGYADTEELMIDGHRRLILEPCDINLLEQQRCTQCSSARCSIFESIRCEKSYARVIYVSDAFDNVCFASRLTATDLVIARSPLPPKEPNSYMINAPIVTWCSEDDLYRCFVQFCQSPYALVHSNPRRKSNVLVLFDYDWSLINENSDTFIFQTLYPELLSTLHTRCKTEPSWTKIMDDMLRVLTEDKPELTPKKICDAVSAVPIQTHMLEALRLAATGYCANVTIISDANSIYIDSMLARHDLTQCVSEIITNPAEFHLLDNGRSQLRVFPYHKESWKPHGCTWCPPNMCKGQIVDALRRRQKYDAVLYVGDGSGDFCAATRLTKNDVVFARADDADGRTYGLQERIDKNPTLVKAVIVPWSTGDDIYRDFALFFHARS
ncbi:hypothetical protein CCR75_008087 [Bremia lactucae]|uniref:Uncharacterized protein n=1 Tax=Bremia lactucae TaxID=4779 RepID=A0A976IKF2_BRELC|nr:hypothetical protein CCR75_008087 [Bremia lactucae]